MPYAFFFLKNKQNSWRNYKVTALITLVSEEVTRRCSVKTVFLNIRSLHDARRILWPNVLSPQYHIYSSGCQVCPWILNDRSFLCFSYLVSLKTVQPKNWATWWYRKIRIFLLYFHFQVKVCTICRILFRFMQFAKKNYLTLQLKIISPLTYQFLDFLPRLLKPIVLFAKL